MNIYLDHNATSPLLPEVREAMEPWLGVPANPASVHGFGQRAAMAVDRARTQVASLIGGVPEGVVFTSGATEANHLFIRRCPDVQSLAVSAVEHPCVLAAAKDRVRAGAQLTVLPVDREGRVRLDGLPVVDLVSVMAANHETGAIQPLEALHTALGARWRHTDATQAAGRIPLQLGHLEGVSLSSHKLGGPGGMGALVLNNGEGFPSLMGGGAQQRGRRAGTVHTAGAVGFGAACASALRSLHDRQAHWDALAGQLRAGLRALGGTLVVDPARTQVLANTVSVTFEDWPGESIVQALDLRGIAASAGAACASGSVEPSPVLLAMGHRHPEGIVRFSLGPTSKKCEIDTCLRALTSIVGA